MLRDQDACKLGHELNQKSSRAETVAEHRLSLIYFYTFLFNLYFNLDFNLFIWDGILLSEKRKILVAVENGALKNSQITFEFKS